MGEVQFWRVLGMFAAVLGVGSGQISQHVIYTRSAMPLGRRSGSGTLRHRQTRTSQDPTLSASPAEAADLHDTVSTALARARGPRWPAEMFGSNVPIDMA
jgi:hypothetical protein